MLDLNKPVQMKNKPKYKVTIIAHNGEVLFGAYRESGNYNWNTTTWNIDGSHKGNPSLSLEQVPEVIEYPGSVSYIRAKPGVDNVSEYFSQPIPVVVKEVDGKITEVRLA